MKNFAIMTNIHKDKDLLYAKETVKLLTENGCSVYLSLGDKKYFEDLDGIAFKNDAELFSDAECVIVFGGDGTIMRAAHKTRLPILGINMGRIGYIAELETNELNLLTELINDNYSIEDRMMLTYTVERQGETICSNSLNDIVFSKGNFSVMPEIELVCNGEEVGKYFADGLIAATPTGSTAYSLTAGGSIVDPGMECFCVTQICPQSFYAKPLIFNGNSVLEFKKGKRGHGQLFITSDGNHICELMDDDRVVVKKSDVTTKLIRIKKNNFYSVMRSKMTDI